MMVEKREWRWVLWVTLAVVVVSWLPYLIAWGAASPSTHFTGLVYNPLDANTYIAKMRLGAEGSWLFRLTYTSEPHEGAPIYIFYLLLGHLARWTGLPLLAVYHGVRTAGGIALSFGIYRLAAHWAEEVRGRRSLYLLASLGGGLGWLLVLVGRQTPDLWVVEAFPFASLLTNAHFPVALALMVWTAHWGLQAENVLRSGLELIAGAAALGAIQPFGLVPLFGGLVGAWVVRVFRERKVPWRAAIWTGLAVILALPYPLFTLWITRTDPVFAAWSAQNVTPSPPLVDWLLGFGLVGLLALPGMVVAARRGRKIDGLLLGWVWGTVLGMALPLALARRLSLGLGVAVGSLAGAGWGRLIERLGARIRRQGFALLLALCALTSLFLLILGASAALAGHPLLYLDEGEWQALVWLRDHGVRDAVVLCAPETGIFVPAWAGQRVVYGHPFETVDADERRAEVESYWEGGRDEAWLDAYGVTYVFYGPRERALGVPGEGELIFQSGDVAIYRR